MTRKNSLKTVVRKTIAAFRPLTVLTVITIIGAIVAALFPPLILERIVNALTAGQPVTFWLALSYLGLLALSGLLESGQNIMITKFGQKITHGLRAELCAKLARLPAAYFTANEPGKITSRFVNDVDAVDVMFTDGIISMFADAFKVLSILAVIFYKSTGLGLLMLLIIPLMFALTRLFQQRMLTSQLANRVAISKVNNHVPETIRNIRMIHTLFRQQYMEQQYDAYIDESYRATDKSNLYDSIYSPIVIFISAAIIALMMILAALGGSVQQFFSLSVGTAVAIIAYVGQIFEPLESIGMEIQNIQAAVAGIRRINEFLQEAPYQHPDSAITHPEPAAATQQALCFEQVSFRYDDDTPVLNDLSFTVASGEAVTFIGRTGAGKSTIFRLALGLYRPDAGRVLINGVAADTIPAAQKRALFGYVEQSFSLVAGTVAEQISLFDPDLSRQQVEAAARLVGLHESILAFPDGYDTPGEKAAFSQGQFQLLAIARAVVAAPQILLLDEITANLDSATERRVLEALKRASQGRTVISISHRLQEYTRNHRIIKIGERR